MSTCKGCGAKIIWITTYVGKKAPIDEESEKFWVKQFAGADGVWRWELKDAHKSHFATCPKANDFRKIKNDAG